MAYNTVADYEAYEREFGHPALGLSPSTVAELIANRIPLPRRQLAIHLPPGPGQCAHCGVPVPKDQHLAAHAVAGFEMALHPGSGEPLRMLVTHCDACWRTDMCSRDNVSPGSGWLASPGHNGELVGAAGWCEPVPSELALGISLFPGAQYASKFVKLALTAGSLWMLHSLMNGIVTSQGMQSAHMAGPLSALDVPGDATAGHGWNVGLLRVLSGSAPGSGASAANAAETGTLGISWTLAATAFTGVAGTPYVATAGAISNVNALASITAGYARLIEQADSGFGLSTTLRRYQLTVGAGSGELSFNTLAISSGGACSVTSFTLTHGA